MRNGEENEGKKEEWGRGGKKMRRSFEGGE